MNGAVATPTGVNQGPRFCAFGRVMGLHAKIKTQKEVCKVHTYAQTVGGCNLLIEGVEMKHSAGLVLIVVYGPDISGVYEGSYFKNPEKLCAILHAHQHIYVAALVHEVGYRIATVEITGSECAHIPASDTVGRYL